MPKKLTIEEMQKIAHEYRGECLSDVYVNSQTKLSWQCAEGHQWEARPNSIKNGQWCPYCAGKMKGTIADMQRLATKQGGKCLSDTYVNNKTKLLWECAEEHQWRARPKDIKKGNWCPVCAGKMKGTIADMQRIARERDGKCLSKTYITAHTKLIWQCAKGHQWEAKPSTIKRGYWCPYCAGVAKGTIEEMQKIAQEHRGECLSKTYVNSQTKLLWRCAEGHQWKAKPNDIKNGHWCLYCAGKAKLSIEEMQQMAQERGGKCLSKTYINSQTKLLWQCAEGHQWEAKPTDIKSGYWCPYCAGNIKSTIEEMQQIAQERGGKCLSDIYINAYTKLLWQCAEGHQWEAKANDIKNGHWCPTCSSGLGERICREFFEQLFEKKFPRSYPKWLVNQEGNQMELDGYCRVLKLAFEHHGEQHYSMINPFTKTKEALKKRQELDNLKKALCSHHGILLIEVPEIPTRTPIEKVKEYIKRGCQIHGVELPRDFDLKTVDLKKAYTTSMAKEVLKELQELAKKHGGKCLSHSYINSGAKFLWQCAEGHRWKANQYDIKNGHWCPYCAGSAKLTITEMRRIAEERGGRCLSDSYVNNKTELLWECAKGHQWKAKPNTVKNGHWCPYCAGNIKSTIEEMRRIAEERGGKCLSDSYVNNKTEFLWECAKGHQWRARPDSIKRGHWCPYCAGNIKGTIEKMQKIAQERGGKCLSDTYVNANTKLLWQCAKGHQWKARPVNITRLDHWCPYCAGVAKSTIEEMHAIAEKHGGRCLSNVYINNKTKLLWECAEGHQWKAIPSNIKRGHWCPRCARLKKRTKK